MRKILVVFAVQQHVVTGRTLTSTEATEAMKSCFNGVCELAHGAASKSFPDSVKTVGEYKQLYGEFPEAWKTSGTKGIASKGAEIAWKATKGTTKTAGAGAKNVVKFATSPLWKETIESLKEELKKKDAKIADLKAELEEQTKEKEHWQQFYLKSAKEAAASKENVKNLQKKNTDLQKKNKEAEITASGLMSWLRKAQANEETDPVKKPEKTQGCFDGVCKKFFLG